MTRDEHEKKSEQEARDFFYWLEGYVDGSGRTALGLNEALTVHSRLNYLNEEWLARGMRVER